MIAAGDDGVPFVVFERVGCGVGQLGLDPVEDVGCRVSFKLALCLR